MKRWSGFVLIPLLLAGTRVHAQPRPAAAPAPAPAAAAPAAAKPEAKPAGKTDPKLEELFGDNKYQLTGVAVSAKGRLFTNYPVWSPVHKYCVVEVTSKTESKPYPDEEWNSWKPGDDGSKKFVSVQAVHVDDQDKLWVVDPANPGFAGVYQQSDKLVRINLSTNKIERVYSMKGVTDSGSYINDVRVDTKRQIAYMTNSNQGGIVIVDLKSGKARMVLKGAPPTQTDPSYKFMVDGREVAPDGKPLKVNSDGIALSADREWLFFKPLTDDKLYKVRTADLRNDKLKDSDLVAKVVDLGHVNITDGMAIDKHGNLYFGDLEKSAIIKISPKLEKTTLVTDARLVWPDSYAISKDGAYLYVSTAHVYEAPPFNKGVDKRTLPYGLFRLKIGP
jgi:sugar lactone lactonase YvrE